MTDAPLHIAAKCDHCIGHPAPEGPSGRVAGGCVCLKCMADSLRSAVAEERQESARRCAKAVNAAVDAEREAIERQGRARADLFAHGRRNSDAKALRNFVEWIHARGQA